MEFSSIQTWIGGGHCIGVDPYYLAQRLKRMDTTLKLYWLEEDLMMEWEIM